MSWRMPYKMETYLPDVTAFPFQNLVIADPTPIHGLAGFYSTKLSVGKTGAPLYVQLPQCVTKDAFLSTKTGKYCDLQYERLPNTDLVAFFEQIEFTCQDLIDGQKHKWFQNELTHDDIENMMASVTRTYQSGKYILIRAFLPPNMNGGQKFVAYNEKEIGVDLDNIKPSHQVIPLLLIDGVKFSSKSFEIDLKLIQLMVLNEVSSSQILIKRALPTSSIKPEQEHHHVVAHDKPTSTATEVFNTEVLNTEVLNTEVTGSVVLPADPSSNISPADATSIAVVLPADPESHAISPAEPTQVESISKDDLANELTNNSVETESAINQTLAVKDTTTSDVPVEVTFDFDTSSSLSSLEAMTLKKPNEVYYDIYAAARQKAKGIF